MTVIFSYEHVSKVRLKKVHFDCLREYRVSNLGQELDFRRVESYGWGGAGGGDSRREIKMRGRIHIPLDTIKSYIFL